MQQHLDMLLRSWSADETPFEVQLQTPVVDLLVVRPLAEVTAAAAAATAPKRPTSATRHAKAGVRASSSAPTKGEADVITTPIKQAKQANPKQQRRASRSSTVVPTTTLSPSPVVGAVEAAEAVGPAGVDADAGVAQGQLLLGMMTSAGAEEEKTEE
jgi:hypothetical protein